MNSHKDHDQAVAGAGSGSVSAGSKAPYAPAGGAPVGTEAGPDPLGQTPRDPGLEDDGETPGPHAGSGA